MQEQTVVITPDGRLVAVYDDALKEVLGLEDLQLERATNVRWDEDSQAWYVWIKDSDGKEHRVHLPFSKRSDAINFELEILNGVLETFGSNESPIDRFSLKGLLE